MKSEGFDVASDHLLKGYLSRILFLSAFPLLGYYAIREFMAGSTPVLSLVLAMLLAAVIAHVLLKRAGHQNSTGRIVTWLAHIFLFCFSVLLVYRIGFSANTSRLPWLFVFAAATFFLTRPRTGLLWCLSLLATLLLINTPWRPHENELTTALVHRIYLTFLIVTLLLYFAKKTATDYRLEMIRNLARLKGSETRHRLTADQLKKEIAHRAKSETQLDALMGNLDIGVYRRVAAPDGKFIDVNAAMVEMLGFDTKESLMSTKMGTLFGDPIDHLRLYAQVMDQGIIKNVESLMLRQNGSTFTAAISAVASADGQEQTGYIDGVVEDISYRKSLENQIRQSQKMDALGTLAGGIAHDFNNILSAVIGFSELADAKVPPESMVHKDLAQVLAASHRAKELVRQILAFSRRSKIENRPVQVVPIAKEVLNLLRATLPTSIEIQHHMSSDTGYIQGDPTQIHQIILNLCTNAGHAMGQWGGTLTVAIENTDLDGKTSGPHPNLDDGPYLKLTVKDTGTGIPPAIMASIFDPYFTTKEVGEGTGMGLAVVMGIVRGIGGDITVESRVGKGSVFSVYLPAIQQPRPTQPEPATTSALPGGKERILFVDDEPALVSLGKQRLERLGYQVETCTTPIEALERFGQDVGRFDLVITDMTMPGMSGDRLALSLMAIRPDIPVILCTGFSKQTTESQTRKIGIRAFIQKPVIGQELAVTVRQVLEAPTPP
ncbi:MAG: response regulator [Desulfobacterales bacterium]|nr:response regulator [Desulfobacterales bacterium]